MERRSYQPRRFSNQQPSSSYGNNNNSSRSHSKTYGSKVDQGNSNSQRDCHTAKSLVGTCPSMCPEKERSQRERLRDLAVFERLYGDPSKTSPSLAVKKFCRTISTKDVQASDLRPLPVLEDTLNYLMKLLESSDRPFEVIHDFIFDRTRSIRQDLSMQNIFNDRAIWMYEKMVKFHVISHHKLKRCNGDITTLSSIHHLNMEQLAKCLTSLYNLYDVNRSTNSTYDNEAEFRSLYVLLHLDPHSESTGESLSLWFSRLPSSIINSKEMSFARLVLSGLHLIIALSNAPPLLRSFRMGNYRRFLCAVASEATYLQLYVAEPYIIEVRAHALACINASGYKLHPYLLSHLSKILRIKESDLECFCDACGLETSQDDMGNRVLPLKQPGFHLPKVELEYHEFSWLERLEKVQHEE